jgi:hypothetical protein
VPDRTLQVYGGNIFGCWAAFGQKRSSHSPVWAASLRSFANCCEDVLGTDTRRTDLSDRAHQQNHAATKASYFDPNALETNRPLIYNCNNACCIPPQKQLEMTVMPSLIEELRDLINLGNSEFPLSPQERGRKFEKLLHKLLETEDFRPEINLRPDGEEIDGSFLMDSRVFLLEAKWHKTPLPASSIYAFRGKVDGKLVGTVGIFISMSGFSPEAVDAITYGKEINILLFDREDIEEACSGKSKFHFILREKLRAASQYGTVYLTREATKEQGRAQVKTAVTNDTQHAFIICEGPSDAAFLKSVIARIDSTGAQINVIAAGGKLATANLVNSLLDASISQQARFVVLIDSDGDRQGSIAAVIQRIDDPSRVQVVTADPTLEAWAFLGASGVRAFPKDYEIQARTLDIVKLELDQPTFSEFLAALRWAIRRQ